jgi:hypothetical protein
MGILCLSTYSQSTISVSFLDSSTIIDSITTSINVCYEIENPDLLDNIGYISISDTSNSKFLSFVIEDINQISGEHCIDIAIDNQNLTSASSYNTLSINFNPSIQNFTKQNISNTVFAQGSNSTQIEDSDMYIIGLDNYLPNKKFSASFIITNDINNISFGITNSNFDGSKDEWIPFEKTHNYIDISIPGSFSPGDIICIEGAYDFTNPSTGINPIIKVNDIPIVNATITGNTTDLFLSPKSWSSLFLYTGTFYSANNEIDAIFIDGVINGIENFKYQFDNPLNSTFTYDLNGNILTNTVRSITQDIIYAPNNLPINIKVN